MPNDNEDEGLFSRAKNPANRQTGLTRSENFRGNQNALVRPEVRESLAKIATGPNIKHDAQAVMLKLASYGEGDRRGKYAFSSTELCGISVAATSREIRTYPDQNGVSKVTGVETFDAIPASPVPGADGTPLTGVRLRDAVNFMCSKGWATTTQDGPYAPGTDFHEVSLTPAGRDVMHVAATNGGLPDFGNLDGPMRGAVAERSDRDALLTMLARARVKLTTGHDEDSGTTVVEIGTYAAFTFDSDGELIGVGRIKDERDDTDTAP